MAGPGQATNQPLQVDTQSLVGRGPDPNIVGPSAVDALTGAFHKGFITTEDIMSRLDENSKQKKALELEQVQATRKNVGITQQADEETKKAAILDAQLKPGDYGLMNKALSLEGFSVRTNPEGVTDEDRTEIGKRYGALLELKRRQTESATRVKETDIKPVDVLTKDAAGNEVKGQVIRRLFQGNEISPKQFDSWAQEDAVLRHTSLPQFYQLFSKQPGAVATPAAAPVPVVTAPVAAPVVTAAPTPEAIAAANAAPITPEQRAQMVNAGVPVSQAALATSLVQPAQPIQPTAPVQPAPPTTPAIGSTTPGGVFVTGVMEGKAAPSSMKTVNAIKERLNDIETVDNTIAEARSLAVPGTVGPAQFDIVQKAHRLGAAFGSEEQAKIYTNQKKLDTVISNEIAQFVQNWKGAISDKELVFFKGARPSVGSTPEQWKGYLDKWSEANSRLRKVVSGELPPADAAEWAKTQQQRVSSAPAAEAYGGPASTGIPFPAGAGATSPDEKIGTAGGVTYVSRIDPTTGRTRLFMRQ